MKINKEILQSVGLDKKTLGWYEKNGNDNLLKTLIKLNQDNSFDFNIIRMREIYLKMMNHRQRAEIAAYAAKSVLSIFENKCKKDQIVRMAIKVASHFAKTGKVIKYKSYESGIARYVHDLSSLVWMFGNSYTFKKASEAASAAAFAAEVAECSLKKSENTAFYAIDDAVSASYDSNKLELRLIRKAVKILERDSKNSTNSLSEKSQALIALA